MPKLPPFFAVSAKQRGQTAEALAEVWLNEQGLQLIERNVHCRGGEIDLLMLQSQPVQTVVVIEVRYRERDGGFGGAAASVTAAKQQRIALAARHWLMQHGEYQNLNWRFDVLAMSGPLNKPRYDWLQAAFDLS